MTPDEIKLIPMDDLIEEILSRTDLCIIAYMRQVDAGPPIFLCDSRGPSYLTAIGLCEELKDQIKKSGHSNSAPVDET